MLSWAGVRGGLPVSVMPSWSQTWARTLGQRATIQAIDVLYCCINSPRIDGRAEGSRPTPCLPLPPLRSAARKRGETFSQTSFIIHCSNAKHRNKIQLQKCNIGPPGLQRPGAASTAFTTRTSAAAARYWAAIHHCIV